MTAEWLKNLLKVSGKSLREFEEALREAGYEADHTTIWKYANGALSIPEDFARIAEPILKRMAEEYRASLDEALEATSAK